MEDIPRHGPDLADELRRAGLEIKRAAAKELAEFYPADPDGAQPIAYVWARTVKCEAPNCEAEVPLVKSFWLSNKSRRKHALRYDVIARDDGPPMLHFEIFAPKLDGDVPRATVNRAKATCPCCGAVLSAERVRMQLAEQRGGATVIFDGSGHRLGGAILLAVVTLRPSQHGRNYRLPNDRDYLAYWKAARAVEKLKSHWDRNDLCPVPNEALPPIGTLGFDLFNARQSIGLAVISRAIRSRSTNLPVAVVGLLALAVGKTADLGNAAAPWKRDAECPVNLLGSQRVRPPWEWGEAVITSESSGSFLSAYERTASALEAAFAFQYEMGSVTLADATDEPLPGDTASVWFTDPPYYDAIPYADLSDFFFVWLKRILVDHPLLRDPFDPSNTLTPKKQEIVQDESKEINGCPKDRELFERNMAQTFLEGRRVLREDGVGSVVFAHKTT